MADDELAAGLVLTEKQVGLISAAFDKAAGSAGAIEVQQVEELAAQLFRATLSDDILDVIIDLTDGADAVSREDFIEIMAAIMERTTQWGSLATAMQGPVGFDSLPQQLNAKALKRGFEFNLMMVGEGGLGKSTLVDTLFNTHVSRATSNPTEHAHLLSSKTMHISTVTHVLEENGVRLKLSITDTPGFGEQVDNSGCWNTVLQHVKNQFEDYLTDEISVNRPTYIPDGRIHCCLYFIAPTGHGLKPLDLEFMKQLQHWVNLVPVIAKADSLTVEERKAFKARIREDLEKFGVAIYPLERPDDDDQEVAASAAVRDLLPFAVVGSREAVPDKGGKMVRGRKLPGGYVEVDNPKHCEFTPLRNMLLKTHTQDLKEVTSQVHYEAFRRQHLTGGQAAGAGGSKKAPDAAPAVAAAATAADTDGHAGEGPADDDGVSIA